MQKTWNHKCKVKKKTLLEDKNNFITFVCKAVNISTQREKKSDMIKTPSRYSMNYRGMLEFEQVMEKNSWILFKKLKLSQT